MGNEADGGSFWGDFFLCLIFGIPGFVLGLAF